MVPNSYRILKLRSGEQIICEIKGSTKEIMKIMRPMAFRSAVSFDGTGSQREFTVLRDWLNHTNQIETTIPKDFIITILVPDEKIASMYDREKERSDEETTIHEVPQMPNMDTLKNFLQNEIEDTLKEIEEEEDQTKKPGGMMDQNEMMVLSLALPLDELKTLIDNDIIDLDDIKQAFDMTNKNNRNEKISEDMDTSSEIDREDFGDKWTDWSPFAEDYLNDEESDE
jgi:hypothetical protein